jgi:Flp pilus assembly pilin Flp
MREIFSLVGRIYTEGLDTLEKGLKGIDKQLTKSVNKIDRFGRDVQKLGTSMVKLTAPIAAVGAGLTALAVKTGQYADHLLDLEQITGLSTDSLQELESVARTAGVDFDGLTGIITKFQGKLPQIISGNGEASNAIKALGVDVFDASGSVRDMNKLFPEMVKRLQSIENITDRNALAQQIFGKSMKDLAPVLGMTAGQFDAAKQEAHDMGLVMSKDALNSANDFRVSMEKLGAQATAVGRNIAVKFIPILQDVVLPLIRDKIAPALMLFADKIAGVITWFSNLSPIIQDTIAGMVIFAVAIGPILIGVGKAITMVKTLVTTIKLLSAAMIANPIGLIITLIALLVTAGIVLYRNWDTVKEKLSQAWDAIAYATQQAVSYMKTLIISYIKLYVDGVNTIAKYIPVLGPAVAGLKAKLDEMLVKEKDLRYERKLSREEAKLQARQTEELTATIAAAKVATQEYTVSTLQEVAAKEKDVEATRDQIKADQELHRAKSEFESGWSDTVRGEIMTRAQLLDWEYKEALSKAEDLGADRQDIDLYYSIQRMRQAQEEQKEKDKVAAAGNAMQKFMQRDGVQMGMQALDQLAALGEQQTDLKLARLDQETARNRAAIENSLMSEEMKKTKIAALEADADKKKKALMIKQAKRDKAAAIFGAVVNTFQAVSKALTLGFPLGLIMAGIFGALGAIQIGMIAAAPLPQLAEGGLIKSRSGGVDVTVGEGKEDELVLPMKTGVRDIVRGILSGVAGAVLPPTAVPALAMGGGSSASLAGVPRGDGGMHLHIHGTLIADDSGLKNLEKTLYKFRVAEAQRKGQ